MGQHGHASPGREAGDLGADLDHLGGELMAKDLRHVRGRHKGRTKLILVPIRAADAAPLRLEPDLLCTQITGLSKGLDAAVVRPV
jgi:hypothetical protein